MPARLCAVADAEPIAAPADRGVLRRLGLSSDITREDAIKRSALVASGKFWVWSVTWEDVQSAMDGKLETTLADCLEAMCFNSKGQLPPPIRSMLDDSYWTQHAVAVLLQWLGRPTGDSVDQHARKLAHHAGATAFRMVPHPISPQLEDARNKLLSFWNGLGETPCEPPAKSVTCGNVNDLALNFRYWWPSELAVLATPLRQAPALSSSTMGIIKMNLNAI